MSYSLDHSSESKKRMHYSPNMLSCVDNALENQKIIAIEYDSREKGTSNRMVEPMALIYKNRKRHLVGWCRLREAWRTFRLDRISLVKVMCEDFNKRDGFNVEEFEVDDEEFYDNNGTNTDT
ncbi:MAG: helix-turn-helix transcriptional regulator [Chitinophagales bacterium]